MSNPDLKSIAALNEGETITQIIPFGNNSLACLTSNGRVIVPGHNFGEWFDLPVPPPFSSIGH